MFIIAELFYAIATNGYRNFVVFFNHICYNDI
jgi:hypothetical protein